MKNMRYIAQLAKQFKSSGDDPDVFVNKETINAYLNNDMQTL